MKFGLVVSAQNIKALESAVVSTLGSSEFEVKYKPLSSFAFLYREIGFEYLSLHPTRFQKLRIFLNRVIQEVGQNGFRFLSEMSKTYELNLDEKSATRFVDEVSKNFKTWISRTSAIQGFRPYSLRHNIEYDFSRNFYQFDFLFWGMNDGLSTFRSIELSIARGVMVEVHNYPSDNVSELLFLEHQNVQIDHGDLVSAGLLRFPIDSWNLFDGSIPTADLVKIGSQNFAISATPGSLPPVSRAICFGSSTNWYHFIVEVFPRYLLFGIEKLRDSLIVIPDGAPIQVQELLSFISSSPVYLAKPREAILCEQVTSCIDKRIQHGLDVDSRKSDLKKVRNFFENSGLLSKRKPDRKILIRRADLLFRTIQNYDELELLLIGYGFEVVDPGTLSFKQQAKLFSESKVVIGQAGAAFTNFIFLPPESHVVEISDTDFTDTFWREFALCFAKTHKKFVLNRRGVGLLGKYAPSFTINIQEFREYCRTKNYWD